MSKIILDTNFLLVPAQFKVDIFEQLKEFGRDFIILNPTVRELERISRGKGRARVYARIALQLIKKYKIKILKTGYMDASKMRRAYESADNAILKFAEKHGYMVATNDKKLIKRLKNKGIRVIRLRQRKYLVRE